MLNIQSAKREVLVTESKTISSVMHSVESGRAYVPDFQRNYVWNSKDCVLLIDSILKQLPIGNLTMWSSSTNLRTVRSVGNIDLVVKKDGEEVSYILDGQQRITTLYAIYKGATINNIDFNNLYIDLDNAENYIISDELVVYKDNLLENETHKYFPVKELFYDLEVNETEFISKYGAGMYYKMLKFSLQFINYPLPTSTTYCDTIFEAMIAFNRINATGRQLTLLEIMNCIIFDNDKDFSIAKKLVEMRKYFKNKYNEPLQAGTKVNYEHLLKITTLIHSKQATNSNLPSINATDFIDNWDNIVKAFELAYNFTKVNYTLKGSSDIFNIVVWGVVGRFYYQNNFKQPNSYQFNQIKKYYFTTGLTNAYQHASAGKQELDATEMDKLVSDKQYTFDRYDDNLPNNVYVYINLLESKSRDFLNNSLSKTVQNFLAMNKPKSFHNGSNVLSSDTENNVVHKHHIYPDSSLMTDVQKTNIFNLAFLDEESNRSIGNKNPNIYFNEAKTEMGEKEFEEVLKSQFIGDLDEYGITTNNYELFINKRGTKIIQSIYDYIGVNIRLRDHE